MGLAGARMAEDCDVRVGVAALVEGIDHDGRAGRVVTANDQALRLLEVGVLPRQESGERRRVEDTLALETVGAAGASGEKAVEHSECAGLELAEDGACGGVDRL